MGGCWYKKRAIMRDYDTMADNYDLQYREEQEEKYEAALSLLRLNADDRILDVGCGTGLLIRTIAGSIARAVGVDLSVRMLEYAKRRCGGLMNVSLIRADADHLPLRGGMFDKAFAITLIQNMPDPGQTIRELVKAAGPGSRLVITGQKRAFCGGEFRRLLERQGLVVVEMTGLDHLRDFIGVCGAC